MAGIMILRQNTVRNVLRTVLCAAAHHIRDRKALASLIPSAFKLIGGRSSAP